MYSKRQILFTAIIATSLLSSCSSSPSGSGERTSNDGAIQFSNISELNYTAGATQSYHISAHDLLDIEVFQSEELSKEVRVNPDGYILLPLIGKVKAAGLTQEKLQSAITSMLGKSYLQNPKVTIFIKEYTSQRVTLGGDISRPGVIPIIGQMTLLQAIAQSGGVSDLGKPTDIIIFRKTKRNSTKAYLLNLKDIHKGKSLDPYLQNEDKIVIQGSKPRHFMRELGRYVPFLGYSNSVTTVGK